MLCAPPKAEQGWFCRRDSSCSPAALVLGARQAFHPFPLPQQPGITSREGAAGQDTGPWQGGLRRAAAAGIIRQKLICKENLATVRANIDFVFACFCRA